MRLSFHINNYANKILKNIKIYILLTLKVYSAIYKKSSKLLFSRLANHSYQYYKLVTPDKFTHSITYNLENRNINYSTIYEYKEESLFPNPLLFLIFNILIAIMVSYTNDVPYVLDFEIEYNNFLKNVSMGFLVEFIEYILGSIIFALLLSKASYYLKIKKKKIPFNIVFNMICFASAWFIPIMLIYRFYIDLNGTLIEQFMLYKEYNIKIQDLINSSVIIIVFIWTSMKLLWLKFIAMGVNRIYKGKIIRYFFTMVCFFVLSYSIPLVYVINDYSAIDHILKLYENYDEALESKNVEKIKIYSVNLMNNKRISKDIKYKMLLSLIATSAYSVNPQDNYTKELFNLLCKKEYSKIEEEIFDIIDNEDKTLSVSISINSIRKALEYFKDEYNEDEDYEEDDIFLTKTRYEIIRNFRLTPYDDANSVKQLRYWLIISKITQ